MAGRVYRLSMIVSICSALAILFALPAAFAETSQPVLIAGLPSEEAMKLGEKMYRQGILPSGEPMQAMVKGDIPVEGDQFTCAHCHLRSGFGISEGKIKTPPTDGARLYTPTWQSRGLIVGTNPGRFNEKVYYPAYTDETLAKVLETGVDPTGRQLDDIMPKYFLNEKDMAIFVYYLKNLSIGQEPGVTDTQVRFATIVSDDVPQSDRDAMLIPLKQLMTNRTIAKTEDRNTFEMQMWRKTELWNLTLSVWELKGPASTWRKQLEEYYRREPVFAIVGGMTSGEWEPIHRFCEENEIPALFPFTDFPVVSSSDWYTLYFSKGFYQEGETAALYLDNRMDEKKVPVVQVFRNDRRGTMLARAFEETWTGLGRSAPENVSLEGTKILSRDFWASFMTRHPRAVFILWLDSMDFPDLKVLSKSRSGSDMIFASARLLGQKLFTLPEKERKLVYLTYPYSLPQDMEKHSKALKKSPVLIDNPDLLTYKISSLFSVMNAPLSMMRGRINREYFLETVDNMVDLSIKTAPIIYPRMSFGQGQRYAAKGCYVVQIAEGKEPKLVTKSEWVIH